MRGISVLMWIGISWVWHDKPYGGVIRRSSVQLWMRISWDWQDNPYGGLMRRSSVQLWIRIFLFGSTILMEL